MIDDGWRDLMPEEFRDVITNAQGGSQHKILGRYDLLPPKALDLVAAVLEYGAETYGVRNWEKIPPEDHLNHALAHVFTALRHTSKRKQKEELSHAACRVLFALDML